MSGFAFLHAADLHLDSPLRGLDPDAPADRIRGAARHALKNLVDAAIARNVAFVLLAGDLYDTKLYDWHTGQFLVQQLGRLKRADIETVAIAGNHDPLQELARKLDIPGMLGAEQPETRRLHNAPVAVHGQSYAVVDVKHDLSAAYPPPVDDRFNIGLLHTACGLGGHENYAPTTVADLARLNYDYWALGHVHTRTVLCRDPWVVFPGNLQGRHINENGAKGATLVTVERGQVQSADPLALDVLRWRRITVDATGAATAADVLNRARLQLDEAMLLAEDRFLVARVELVGDCPAHADLAQSPDATLQSIRAVAAESAGPDDLFIESVRVATRPALDLAAMRDQGGAVGALMQALQQPATVDDALLAFAKDQVQRSGGALDPDHPALAIAAGLIPPDLADRARALVLAELARR